MTTTTTPLNIGFLLFPNLTQLDLTGPYEVLAKIPGATTHLIWKDRNPVQSEAGLSILPTRTFDACPDLDVICIPGGPGQSDMMADDQVLDFVRQQGTGAQYVTAVCTGALVLGAAGLLDGYKATTHWASMPLLELFGATAVDQRVVVDGNRITGGGVTAGIDFGLTLAAILAGDDFAQGLQLMLEYNPAPPFKSGHPSTASQNIHQTMLEKISPMLDARREVAVTAAARLNMEKG